MGELFVRIGLFKKVKYSFLPVGHTHEDIDAMFGALSHFLHRYSAYSFEEVKMWWCRAWPSMRQFDYISVRLCIHGLNEHPGIPTVIFAEQVGYRRLVKGVPQPQPPWCHAPGSDDLATGKEGQRSVSFYSY